jgi:ATP-dependent DNA helicase RecG
MNLQKYFDYYLEFLKTHPTITNRQAREITGIRSENLLKVEFYKLRDQDRLEMVPALRGHPQLGG